MSSVVLLTVVVPVFGKPMFIVLFTSSSFPVMVNTVAGAVVALLDKPIVVTPFTVRTLLPLIAMVLAAVLLVQTVSAPTVALVLRISDPVLVVDVSVAVP